MRIVFSVFMLAVLLFGFLEAGADSSDRQREGAAETRGHRNFFH